MTSEQIWKTVFNIAAVISAILFIKYSRENDIFWGIFWFVAIWVSKLLAERGYDWFDDWFG